MSSNDVGSYRPNILLIMSDEHARSIAGCYGDRIVQTPNMDWLAETGVTFEDGYCNSPLCGPSRLSFTAGKYVSRVGAWTNNSWLPSADIASLPRLLNAAGYESFLCGKQHYDYSRRYGFTEVGGDFNRHYKTGHTPRVHPNRPRPQRISARFDEFHSGEESFILRHDRRVAAGAAEFLASRRAEDKPFFLFAGYLAPHFPLIVPGEYYERYRGRVPMPTIPPGFLDTLAPNYQVLRSCFEIVDVPEEIVRRGRELYYGLTNWLDDEIGKVLSALRANRELANNTLIIYTSDHGENLGEHGMWWKNCMYEQSTGVPMVVSWPGRWAGGQRRKGACSLLDLGKTLADIAGAIAPDDWDGDSLMPWLDDPNYAWKDFAASEYYGHNIASGYAMCRSRQWKYTYHTPADESHPAFRELYNLAADPGEFVNLATHPAHAGRVAELHARLVKELRGDPDDAERRARWDLSQGNQRSDPRPPHTCLG